VGAVTEVTSVVQDGQDEPVDKGAAPASEEIVKEIAEVKSQLDERAKEIEVLTNQVIKAESKEMAATGKVLELEQKILELEKGIDSASQKSQEAAHEAKKYADEAHRTLKIEQEKVNALEADVAQQAEKVDAGKEELASLKGVEERLTADLQEQSTRAEKAESEILVLCEQVVARENETKALQELADGLQKKLGDSEQQLKGALVELKERSNKGEGETGKENTNHGDEAQELTKLRADLLGVTAERDALRAAAEFNTNTEKDTAGKLASTEELQKKTLAKLKEEKKAGAALKKEVTSLKKQMEEAGKVREKEEEAVVNTLRVQLTNEKEEAVRSVQAELAALTARYEETAQETKALEARLEESQRQMSAAQESLGSASAGFEERAVEAEGQVDLVNTRLQELEKEMSSMSEKTLTLQRKLESSQKEAEDARIERERLRKRVLELEGEVEQAALLSKESISESSEAFEAEKRAWEEEKGLLQEAETSLKASVTEMQSRLKDALQQVKVKNVDLAKAEEQAAAATGTSGQAQIALEATVDENLNLKKQLETKEADLSESQMKTDALSNKIARLKTLLQRSKELAQEKELEVERLAEKAARAKRFQVLALVTVPTASNDGQNEDWCLVLDHGDTGTARWIKHTEVQSWLVSGSSLVGTMPEGLQTQHSREIKTVRIKLEKERDEAVAEIKELTDSFAAYKARAQTALKRVGNEERQANESEEERERLTQELARSSDEIIRLEKVVEESRGELAAAADSVTSLRDQLGQEKEAFESAAREAQSVLAGKEDELTALKSSVISLEARVQHMEEDKLAVIAAPVATQSDLRAAVPATPIAQRTPLKTEESPPAEQQHHTSANENDSHIITQKRSPSPRVAMSSQEATTQNHKELDSLLSASGGAGGVFLSPQPEDASSPMRNAGESMLLKQANQDLSSALADVRAQNSSLYNEVQDLTHKFALNAEQTQSLKAVIRELEATLAREREFNNTAPHAVNMEYLTNIIRKFLLSSAPSERAKLASVLCQILHFSSTEVHFIEDVWREKRGLAALFGSRIPLAAEVLPPDMGR
jgi:chromosome segregation ATPase